MTAWKRNASVRGVTDYLSAFGVKFSESAVHHILDASARKLESAAEQIRTDLGESGAHHYDETGASLNGKGGRVLIGVTNSENGKLAVVAGVDAGKGGSSWTCFL